MRPNNRQRSRGGRNGGGGGNHNQHKQQHNHNPNRPPNRNQIFDSSGPDVRVRGNAHQVYDKYQALAREAAAMGDRIQAEAYWQYADHYFRVIQSQGGFVPRTNQWGESGEEGQQQNPQQEGQPPANGTNGSANGSGPEEGYASNDRQHEGRQHENRQQEGRQNDGRQDDGRQDGGRPHDNRQNDGRQNDGRQNDNRQRDGRQSDARQSDDRAEPRAESEPGLGGVAFLQSGRSAPPQDPAVDDQPEVPEFRPSGRRGS
jgi:hypothetical protein